MVDNTLGNIILTAAEPKISLMRPFWGVPSRHNDKKKVETFFYPHLPTLSILHVHNPVFINPQEFLFFFQYNKYQTRNGLRAVPTTYHCPYHA